MAQAGSPFLGLAVKHVCGDLHLDVALSLTRSPAVLFGPSGSGKTTLLRAIAGLLRPRQARIAVRGLTLTDTSHRFMLPPEHRSLGFVMQRPALFPHMSATENVAFGVRGLDRQTRSARTEEMLDLVSAQAFRQRRPGSLSGGEQQRIALARALAPRPRLLLLDEPLTGMQSGLKADILRRLTGFLDAHSIPLFYVTHDLPEIFALGAHVVVLEAGRVLREGPADVVLAEERESALRKLGAALQVGS